MLGPVAGASRCSAGALGELLAPAWRQAGNEPLECSSKSGIIKKLARCSMPGLAADGSAHRALALAVPWSSVSGRIVV